MAVAEALEAIVAMKLKDVLTKHCITNVSSSDASKADHVILGKPGVEKSDPVCISIHVQHPLGRNEGEERPNTSQPTRTDPWKVPAETWGGMNTRVHIGAVQIDIREDVPYEEAVYINAAVAARVKKAIDNDADLGGYITDDFGSTMSRIQTFEASGYTGGGGNVSIHTRWVNFRWLEHSPNARS